MVGARWHTYVHTAELHTGDGSGEGPLDTRRRWHLGSVLLLGLQCPSQVGGEGS